MAEERDVTTGGKLAAGSATGTSEQDKPQTPEERFASLMGQLFQLSDAEELDFGYYRIIKRHNRRVRQFLGDIDPSTGRLAGNELAAILDASFLKLEDEARQDKKREFARLGKDLGISANLDGKALNARLAELTESPRLREDIAYYRDLRAELHDIHYAESGRAEVLNRLYEFYARHYQDGDFIVQRRYGKHGVRYVRSTGDDTEYHWATEDMYYIKSGDVFSDYPVLLPNGRRVVFCVDAESLQKTRAELKPNDRAHYKLKRIVPVGHDVNADLRVELTYLKGTQKKSLLDEIAVAVQVRSSTPSEVIARHLRRYVARNQSDFFIHKRLKQALDEDLDIYLKTEVLNADQLLADNAAPVAARTLRVARVIRQVARQINAFLGALEDHQKRLWEKKKLVLDTRYVITLDRLQRDTPDWLTEHIDRIVAVQRGEWRELGLGDYATAAACRRTKPGDLATEASERYLPLPVDTGNFKKENGEVDEDFKWSFLAAVTKTRSLDEALDGVAIHSDNWQALNTLQAKYRSQVKCIYIDPPYNTGGDGFPYKDAYQHSSWMAMMEDRLRLCSETLKPDGALFSSIDQNEYPKLRTLLEWRFGRGNALGTIVWKNVTDNNPTNIAIEHEYVECFAKNRTTLESEWKSPYSDAKELLVKLGRNLVEKYGDTPELQRAYQEWLRANKEFLGPLEGYKHIDADGIYAGSRSVHNPGKEGYRYDIIHPQTKKPCKQPLMGYRFPENTYKRLHTAGRILFGDSETKLIELKVYAYEYSGKLPSVIELDGRSGANDLTNLFGEAQTFKNPKASALLQELIPYVAGRGDVIMDFFVGSGTTPHALMRLNNRYSFSLKWLGIEASHNFDRLVLPRVKKAAFSVEWLKGVPTNTDGPGAFMRVQTLEQYEDTLENLSTGPQETGSLFDGAEALSYELDDALARIALDSAKFTHPFGTTLKRIVNSETIPVQVDLVESLVYLLGLIVDRLYRDECSVVLTGRRNGSGETVAVLWRGNVLHGAEWVQAKMAMHPADRTYTNEPGLLMFDGAERLQAIEAVFVEAQSGQGSSAW